MVFSIQFKIAIIISVLGLILTITLCGIYFRFSYFEPDTVSYLFQAKLFAHGKLCEKSPPEFGFSSSPHINILNGKWYSKYPFGNALMLTLGVFVNAPWLIPAIVTSLSLLFLFLLISNTYGKRTALVATVLGLISPATLVMGATWFSEPVSRFFLAIFLFSLIKTLSGYNLSISSRRRQANGQKDKGTKTQENKDYVSRFRFHITRNTQHATSKWFYPLISGFSLGYVLNTRPLTAFAFGLCSGFFVFCWILRTGEKKSLIKAMLFFLISFFVMVFVCMAWNYYFTGNPLKFTHNAAQPHDKIGFGKRSEGYDPNLENAFVFTPEYALRRLWQNVLPCISLNTLGWGYYQPNVFRRFVANWKNNKLLPLGIIPLIFPFILMFIPVFHSSRNRYDFLFLSFFLVTALLYFFFYFDGSTFGFTAINARYYTECTLLGIIPLMARGIFIVYGWISSITHKWSGIAVKVVAGLLAVALTINTVHTYILQATPLQNWGAVYQKLPRLVKENDIHNAVVFIPHHRGAPLGEYPFKSLEEADVVYFKLGPSKMWKLTNSDWKAVWNKYFKKRKPYIYEGGKLNSLDSW